MKKSRKYALWAALSIMLQCSVVIYLDKVHFRQSSDFILTEVKEDESKKNITVSIPNDAKEIGVSYDGKYATYIINDKFYILDTNSGESTEIITNDGDREVLYSMWLPDRNAITIAEKKKNDSGKNVVNILNYNAKTNVSVDVKEICNYSKGTRIDKITTSTSAGVTYVSVSKGKGSSIYRVDIEHKKDTVESNIDKLGSMKVFPSKDILIYSNKSNKKFYSYTNGKVKKMKIDNSVDLILLSLIGRDKIIMGKIEDGKVKEVLSGSIDSNISTWEKKELNTSVDIDDIYINNESEILINYKLEGEIINLSTSKSMKYDGKLISINDKVLYSIENGKLHIKRIEK